MYSDLASGTTICLSGRMPWPLLVLAGTAAALGIVITSSGLWGKKVSFLEKHGKDAVLKVACGELEEDMISQLPDDILSQVVSRLSLIEAIRTRILSRRWKDICRYRSSLLLDCCQIFGEIHNHSSCYHKLRFVKAVDQCLQLYSGGRLSDCVLICCLGKDFTAEFNRWMQTIANLGIQQLTFRFYFPFCADCYGSAGAFQFPFQLLFEAASLTHLHLLTCALQPSFKGKFSSLQSLYLYVVPLDNGELSSIFSSCVNLKHMTLVSCKLPAMLCISGQLSSMVIELCCGLKEIDMHASNLTDFVCYSDGWIKCSFPFAPKLANLCVNVNGRGTLPSLLGEVANCCTQLDFLAFQTKTDELRYIPATTNRFCNLTVLYLLMMFDSKVDLFNVTPILDACPLLEKLRLLARSLCGNVQRRGNWPAKHHTCLKAVHYEGFRGTGNEIEFASFVLRSAEALQFLCIYPSYSLFLEDFKGTKDVDYGMNNEERQLVYKQLKGMQALSSKVTVIIS